MASGYCAIADPGCDAPAGFLIGDEVAEMDEGEVEDCPSCGQEVCEACSSELADGTSVCRDCADDAPSAVARAEVPPDSPHGVKVMAKMCRTCVFSPASPVGAARLRDLERQWRSGDTHQVCHYSATASGDDDDWDDDDDVPPQDRVVCRGFFDNRYLTEGLGQLLRISERLGGFNYVDPATYYDESELPTIDADAGRA